jgi:cytosine/adenosine deaminase-related metal-dependent hydrolase
VIGWLGIVFTIPLASAATWAIHGDMVLPDQVAPKRGWLLFDEHGIRQIDCAEKDIPADARRHWHKGFIFPSLIDCHNHAEWNAIPLWRAGKLYSNRYEWQKDAAYVKYVKAPYYNKIHDGQLDYASLKYAEVRALIGGTTVLQSTYADDPPQLFMRNLDTRYHADSRVGNIFQITEAEKLRFRDGLASGKTRRIFFHLAEGKRGDCESKTEFAELERLGLVRPGIVVIHGVALTAPQFKQLADNDMYLVWSPRSNEVLYGETTRIEQAIAAGVTIALAPDWSITGSNNVLDEMKYARAYALRHCLGNWITPRRLFRMATSDAAKVAGLNERLGAIRHGAAADLLLAARKNGDPYESLLQTDPADINLVFIDGAPFFGDERIVDRWVQKEWLPANEFDRLPIQGADGPKSIRLLGAAPNSNQRQTFSELVEVLQTALHELAPLIEKAPLSFPPVKQLPIKTRCPIDLGRAALVEPPSNLAFGLGGVTKTRPTGQELLPAREVPTDPAAALK